MLNNSLSVSWPFKILLLRILCLDLYLILMGLFGILMSSFLSSLYILDIRPLSDVGLVEDLFPLCSMPFCFIDSACCLTEASFMRSHLLIDDLRVYATCILLRKWSPVPVHSRTLLTFSSIRFSVIGFMLRPLIHLDLSFVHGDRYGSICILLHDNIQLYQHHLLKMISFFPLYNFV